MMSMCDSDCSGNAARSAALGTGDKDKDKALLPRDCLGLATVSIASRRLGERQRETPPES